MSDKTITVNAEEYKRLLAVDEKMDMLIAHGVDNWIGYGDAMGELFPDEED